MRGVRNDEIRKHAIQLRLEKRMSLKEISAALNVSQGSLSEWLKEYPLTEAEKDIRSKNRKRHIGPRKDRGIQSKFFTAISDEDLSRDRKAKIAEAAVIFRLALHNFKVYASVFDGDKTDLIVSPADNSKLIKLQIKWAGTKGKRKNGLPRISLVCSQGHSGFRRYTSGEFDFIIGYCLFNDTCYIFSEAEAADNKTSIVVNELAAEQWGKLNL